MSKQKGSREAEAIALATDILGFVNSYGCDSKTFAETICQGHRTLQQSVMRLFIETIRAFSESRYDDRNEATVALSKEIMKIAEHYPLPFI